MNNEHTPEEDPSGSEPLTSSEVAVALVARFAAVLSLLWFTVAVAGVSLVVNETVSGGWPRGDTLGPGFYAFVVWFMPTLLCCYRLSRVSAQGLPKLLANLGVATTLIGWVLVVVVLTVEAVVDGVWLVALWCASTNLFILLGLLVCINLDRDNRNRVGPWNSPQARGKPPQHHRFSEKQQPEREKKENRE